MGGVPVTTTTTFPDETTDEVIICHEISIGAQDNNDINIALAIDTSGSTAGGSGSDLDGDGVEDTFLEAQVFAAKALLQNYIDLGYDTDRVTVTLIDYSSGSAVVGIYNLDDQAAFEAALNGLRSGGLTNFASPLDTINDSWTAQGVDSTANNQIVFLSDGEQNRSGDFTDEDQTLEDNFGANISAIGVGANAGVDTNAGSNGGLNDLDNTGGSIGSNDGAVSITNVQDLIDEINSPPPIVDVDSVTLEFTYPDPEDPNETITFTQTYLVGDPALIPTATGYKINLALIDLEPDPPHGSTIEMKATTNFNNGTDSISTGFITVPFIVCFSGDTLISSLWGEIKAIDIQVGEPIMTKQNGIQYVRWINKCAISRETFEMAPNIRPIRIQVGALGNGLPTNTLIVSPQHRILVSSQIAREIFGTDEVLVAAKKLLRLKGVSQIENCKPISYVHFCFDNHEIVYAEGVPTESFLVSEYTLSKLSIEARDELLEIFPEFSVGRFMKPSSQIADKHRLKQLIHTHNKTDIAIVAPSI